MTVTTSGVGFSHISIKPLHPTFGAEISGVDLSSPLKVEVFKEILQAMTKYGVVVFRRTGLTDEGHIAFSKKFGELDDVKPYITAGRKHRLKHTELFDISNIGADGSILDPTSPRGEANKVTTYLSTDRKKALYTVLTITDTQGNGLFHVDSSFNPRRAGYSLLLAHELPPSGMGGHTAFADTRTAFDTLPQNLKEQLLTEDYIACHSMHHSRKVAAPEAFAGLNPLDYPMGRHKLVQRHETSDRMNLYIAAHVHHIEGLTSQKSQALFDQLYKHATRYDNTLEIEWQAPGDLVIWDNTCTMHRAVGGNSFKNTNGT
ncbi:Taurine catabolism dioxygenase TauD/TfdA [Penicillium expansum]|nr:Taurine catabolism dioxygenase TauD/TfdA [Penicillium expansum]